jgi:pimeloyl-ACP methyl ester carboxylesterase
MPDALLERLRIPIWREGRMALEHAELLRDPVLNGVDVPRGDGAPVLLAPGFLAGDLSLRTMARWLGGLGYRPCRAGIAANVDCTERSLERLEAQLERSADRFGRRVTIVGHSRGGAMARVLAVRRPELVSGIACLGSPLRDQFAVHPLVRGQVRAVALLGSLGVPGLFSFRCRDGCCAEAERDLAAVFPEGVGFLSIYSRSDGVVDWRACLDPAAEAIEVRSSHCGMAINARVYRALGETLPHLSAGAARSWRSQAA